MPRAQCAKAHPFKGTLRFFSEGGINEDVKHEVPLSRWDGVGGGDAATLAKLEADFPGLKRSIEKLKSKGEQLTFAWITPRSLAKGTHGGILARLLSVPNLRLVSARMFEPSDEFVEEYIAAHNETHLPKPFYAFTDFIRRELSPATPPEERGYPNHLMLLLFTGQNARQTLIDVIGDHLPDPTKVAVSRTIRGAYGDYRVDPATEKIESFEPAIVTAHSDEANALYMRTFGRYAISDGGVLRSWYDDSSTSKDSEDPPPVAEYGMVMIKPDMLDRPSSRPGNIIDLFASTGLHLVGCKIFSFSVKEAYEFYGFLQKVFEEKLSGQVEERVTKALNDAFDFEVGDQIIDVNTALLKSHYAKAEVSKIIHYMAGVYPHDNLTEVEKASRGPARVFALLYRGENAVETIRAKLGSTDPSKAELGTIRIDFGSDLMRNSAHASDSAESLVREVKIIGLTDDGWPTPECEDDQSMFRIISMWYGSGRRGLKNSKIGD